MSQTLKLGSDCEIRQMWRQINVFQRGHRLNGSCTTNGVVSHLPRMWFLPDNGAGEGWQGLGRRDPNLDLGRGLEALNWCRGEEDDDGALSVSQQGDSGAALGKSLRLTLNWA